MLLERPPRARRTTFGLSLAVGAILAGCSDGVLEPPANADLVVTIDGVGPSVQAVEIRADDRVAPMALVAGGRWAGQIPGVPTGPLDLEVRLVKERFDVSPDEVHTRFDRVAQTVAFSGAVVELRFPELQRTAVVALRRSEGVALFVDDPCVVGTRFETEFETVDVDRAIYRGDFQEIVSFIFERSDSYSGEELLSGAPGRDAFESSCLRGEWDTADTLACVDTATRIACMHYTWSGRPSKFP